MHLMMIHIVLIDYLTLLFQREVLARRLEEEFMIGLKEKKSDREDLPFLINEEWMI